MMHEHLTAVGLLHLVQSPLSQICLAPINVDLDRPTPSHSASLISAITPSSGLFCCHSFWDYYGRQAPLLSKWHFIMCMSLSTINGQKWFASACCGVSGEKIVAISVQCTQTFFNSCKLMKTNKHASYFYQQPTPYTIIVTVISFYSVFEH